MLFVFCSWILIGFSAILWGIPLTDFFLKEQKGTSLTLTVVCGLCVLTVYAEFFSLFYKVGVTARILLFLADIGILIIKRKSICFSFRSFFRNVTPWVFFWCMASCVMILPLASSYIRNSDTYLYHAQCIRWIEEYGVVKGIGNLHSRIAFDSSFLCLQALFGFEELFGQPMHSVNGFVAWIMLTYSGTSLKVWTRRKILVSDALRLAMFVYLSEVCNDFSSPGTDLFAHCLTLFIFIQWISCLEEKTDILNLQILLSILSVYAFTLKLSAALMVLFAAVPASRMIKERQWKKIICALTAGGLIVLPFCLRNIMISGYLLYPMEQLDLFSVDWKMPGWTCWYERMRTKAWAEGIFGKEDLSEPLSVWFPYWMKQQSVDTLLLVGSDAVVCLCGIVYSLMQGIKRQKWNSFAICVIMALNFFYWFMTAPHIRFGRAIVLIPSFVFFGWIIQKIRFERIQQLSYVVMCLLLLYPLTVLLKNMRAEERHFIDCVDYEEIEMIEYKKGNVILLIPLNNEINGYYEFPVAINEETASKIELRGNSLDAGFRIIEEGRE